ncbi:DNA-binding transcriptional regulator, LysR family [Tistlia consotensis]|uniref:DNA-binding transcriptional regulator, LysR family n=1 Tax=Tistlia consotensis USBA 355 TaxID=560819 RepID=A0A1Y6CJI8_9PROT|nr:transcriptional regulator GcvA [Tistlia consotensis]SMF55735.1 DNA-binding transcriptional regulator, LysR family [Tistlia consotensis USBA 355]SNR89112.1 DNA-binding transcriptional regulator, LysR family [Tistlia consotensis]
MALRLPPLASLRLFEAAGRHESFKLAAEELHLTPSAVSHGILALERWLAVTLFERQGNGVTLTRAGRDYLAFVSEALAMIAVGTRRLPNAHRARRVAVSLPPTFALRWLLPRLSDFRTRHPDISLTLDTAHRQVGFPVDEVDLAVRMARAPWPDLASTCLFTETLVPVCSPGFRERHAADGTLELAGLPLLQVVSATEDWAAWLDAAGLAEIDLSSGLSFDTVQMACEAAAAGLGVAIGRRPLIDADLASGRLVEAAPALAATTGYWLIEAREADARAEVRAVRDWLVARCRAE